MAVLHILQLRAIVTSRTFVDSSTYRWRYPRSTYPLARMRDAEANGGLCPAENPTRISRILGGARRATYRKSLSLANSCQWPESWMSWFPLNHILAAGKLEDDFPGYSEDRGLS